MDTFLTILGALIAFGIMILGAVVTFFAPQTTKAKIYYLVAFFFIGLCGMTVVIWQAIRTSDAQTEAKEAQDKVQMQLADTQEALRNAGNAIADLATQSEEIKTQGQMISDQTKQPVQVTVNPPAIVVRPNVQPSTADSRSVITGTDKPAEMGALFCFVKDAETGEFVNSLTVTAEHEFTKTKYKISGNAAAYLKLPVASYMVTVKSPGYATRVEPVRVKDEFSYLDIHLQKRR